MDNAIVLMTSRHVSSSCLGAAQDSLAAVLPQNSTESVARNVLRVCVCVQHLELIFKSVQELTRIHGVCIAD
jgi:hypothetical protein